MIGLQTSLFIFKINLSTGIREQFIGVKEENGNTILTVAN